MRFPSTPAVASAASSGSARQSLVAKTTKAVGVIFGAIAIGLLGTGGTYAYLNASATGSTNAVVNAGTASLTVSSGAIALTNLYPGQTRTGTFEVTNGGHVDLDLTVASITGPSSANGLVATVSRDSCGADQRGVGGTLGNITKKSSLDVCLTVTMGTDAPDSARHVGTSAITVLLSGVQS